MYDVVVTNVKTIKGNTGDFLIIFGLHQEFTLNSYLFVMIMDELVKCMQDDISWYILFIDIILVDKIKVGLNCQLKLQRNALEFKGFRLNRIKREYMECSFSTIRNRDEFRVKIEDHKAPKSDHFLYLRSVIHKEGEIKDDVVHSITFK